jgi:putative ABC transport system substrate-binding protein
MHRRSSLVRIGALATGLALVLGDSQAQQTSKVPRIGVLLNQGALINGKPSPQFESLRAGMAQLGYVQDTTVIYEPRFADGQLDRLPGFAAELVAMGVDVIVAYGGPPTNAARKATTSIPIVYFLVADPVAIGVAASLERPGGNLTGVTTNDPELAARQMALLKEVYPRLSRVAILSDPSIPGGDANGLAPIDRANLAAASAAGLTPQLVKVSSPKPDLEGAFKTMADQGAEALVVLEVPAVFNIARSVADMGTARRLPTMLWGGQGDGNGLISYGTPGTASFPRLPVFVDRILKGARPADTPVEVLAKRELILNLQVARALGVTIPADLLKRADRVIE